MPKILRLSGLPSNEAKLPTNILLIKDLKIFGKLCNCENLQHLSLAVTTNLVLTPNPSISTLKD